jgi:hypothetical protein
MTDGKIREDRLRRMAQRQGYRLIKSRRRDTRAIDYGAYWLTDPSLNALVTNEHGSNLDQIEDFLLGR